MAHKKGGGSSRNGRDSNPKFLGVKVFGGEVVQPGAIIVRQRGTKIHPGPHVGRGGDDTLFAKADGLRSVLPVARPQLRDRRRASLRPALRRSDLCAHYGERMSFVDQVRIRVRAGDGGDGPRRSCGRSTGRRADPTAVTAATAARSSSSPTPAARQPVRRTSGAGRTKRKTGGDGGAARPQRCADGPDIALPVPVGTVVREARSRARSSPTSRSRRAYVAARGGRGGRGNAALKSRSDRDPELRRARRAG